MFSDSAKIGGVGSLIGQFKEKMNLHVKIESFEYDDIFITHGATPLIEEQLGISAKQLSQRIIKEVY